MMIFRVYIRTHTHIYAHAISSSPFVRIGSTSTCLKAPVGQLDWCPDHATAMKPLIQHSKMLAARSCFALWNAAEGYCMRHISQPVDSYQHSEWLQRTDPLVATRSAVEGSDFVVGRTPSQHDPIRDLANGAVRVASLCFFFFCKNQAFLGGHNFRTVRDSRDDRWEPREPIRSIVNSSLLIGILYMVPFYIGSQFGHDVLSCSMLIPQHAFRALLWYIISWWTVYRHAYESMYIHSLVQFQSIR